MYFELIFFLGITIVGIIVLMVSRTLKTVDEDKWKEKLLSREMLYGPPATVGEMVAVLGILLIVFCVIGTLWSLFLQ